MQNDRALMCLHAEVLFTHDASGHMVSVNHPERKTAPRFFLGRTTDGNEWRFRAGLDADLMHRLNAICMSESAADDITRPPDDAETFTRLLTQNAPIEQLWTGPAYYFPEELPVSNDVVAVTGDNTDLLERYFSEWIEDIVDDQPLMALVRDGQAVAVCCSARKTDRAHEAGVETHPDFRGHGYAGQVVSAWADAVRRAGCMPLYSTSWENTASRAVAAKLELVQYGADLHIT